MFIETVLAISMLTQAGSDQPAFQRVWVDDEEWSVSGAKSFINPRTPGIGKLYAIAPVFQLRPQSTTGAAVPHDLVADVAQPKSNSIEVGGKVVALAPGYLSNEKNTITRTVATPLGELTLVYAADTNGDGVVEPLTSFGRARRAVELHLASETDAAVAFNCLLTLLRQ